MTTAAAAVFNSMALDLYTQAYTRHHGAPPTAIDEYEHIVEPIATALASVFACGADVGPALRGPTISMVRDRLARLHSPSSAPSAPSAVNPSGGGGA
ncbi:MAG: hypothetical protein KF684_04255 [Phycisphaeraceae bacterium]|nr:hypothetical protein [Phycisphaeraceae bacterium]